MVWLALAVLPDASVAVHVIVVVPTGYGSVNRNPSLRTPVGVIILQLSVAWALTTTVAPHVPAALVTD